jgi:prevent-host-death family protein
LTNSLGQATFNIMTIHVNIGEAKAKLSKLIAASLRGEDVVIDNDGKPQIRLVPVERAVDAIKAEIAAKRKAAFGFAKEKYAHLPPEAFDVPPSMTDEEIEERFQRKFGAPSS